MVDGNSIPIVFPSFQDPEVSIVVPTIKNPARLRRCLAAVAAEIVDGFSAEVVVVLDGAEDDLVEFVSSEVRGATVLRWPERRGLPAGFNAAARATVAPKIAILQDDAVPQRGWMTALLSAACEYPRAGVIGSLVLWPNGTVQLAGAVVHGDGHVSLPWLDEPPPPSSIVGIRAADYVGSTSALIDRVAWMAIGGFDESFYPAVYVDVDTCMAAWQAGWQVLVEPASVVVHDRGGSTRTTFREFLYARNHKRFLAKWQPAIAGRAAYPFTLETLETARLRLERWLNEPPAPSGLGMTPRVPKEQPSSNYVALERDVLRDYSTQLESWLATCNTVRLQQEIELARLVAD